MVLGVVQNMRVHRGDLLKGVDSGSRPSQTISPVLEVVGSRYRLPSSMRASRKVTPARGLCHCSVWLAKDVLFGVRVRSKASLLYRIPGQNTSPPQRLETIFLSQ